MGLPARVALFWHLEVLMSLLALVFTLIVVGVLLWLVNSYIPMDAAIKRVLNIVVVVAVVLWLLNAFGLFGYLGNVHAPNVGGK